MILIGTAEGLRTADGTTLLDGEVVHVAVVDDASWVLTADRIYRGEPDDFDPVAPTGDIGPTCVLPTPVGVFVGGADARLYRLDGSSLERVASFDAIAERDTWYTPWGGPPDVRSMSLAPDGTIYVGVHVGGILRSRDDGASWQQTIDIDTDIHQVIAVHERVIATGWDALHVSTDGGNSWTEHREGFDNTYMRAAAVAGDVLLVTAAHSHAGKDAGVYRRVLDGDDAFERVEPMHPSDHNIDTHWLAASGSSAAYVTAEGDLFVSSDHGSTWSRAATGIAAPRCVAILPDGR